MPSASAAAPASPSPSAASANARPTAMPSGILCSVMADRSRKSLCVTRSPPRCRVNSSSSASSSAPSTMPAAAGRNGGSRPSAAVCSMAGRMRLHTLAAVITPAAKPSSAPCARSQTARAKKNTVAAPSAVIRNVKDVPSHASIRGRSISVHRLYGLSGGSAPVCQYKRGTGSA